MASNLVEPPIYPYKSPGRVHDHQFLLFNCWSLNPHVSVLVYYTWVLQAIYWIYPPPSNGHHQDCSILSRESQPKPSFATVTAGWGGRCNILLMEEIRLTTWHVWNPVNKGINYQPQLVSRISSINRYQQYVYIYIYYFLFRWPQVSGDPWKPSNLDLPLESGWRYWRLPPLVLLPWTLDGKTSTVLYGCQPKNTGWLKIMVPTLWTNGWFGGIYPYYWKHPYGRSTQSKLTLCMLKWFEIPLHVRLAY